MHKVTWEDKSHHSPASSFFAQLLLFCMMSYSVGYPFDQLRSAVMDVSPANFLES